MADADASKLPSLSEHYLLDEKDHKPVMAEKSVEASEVKPSVDTAAKETVHKTEETPIESEVAPAAGEGAETTNGASGESKESSPVDDTADSSNSAPSEENSDSTESGNSADQEADETPEIKLETAPADFRFPTTNQTRHCFTRYIEYHRCVAAKGEEAPECDKFAKYYRSLCPGEWIDRWNEQRENGTFPGPL
ncbi:cytochrome C oxidase 6B [Perilla frutescens var. hirtella]|uniref:Cytochrome C oxidase 6B n=1 Tax=Perilla frutescens var. hirtella TaxID=608512 RepID=A0AAD4IMY4_PERFH|nr:cytochrome C oxidase 6B [Perilla frutescens var. hirtella]KAH6778905.1 cytochrome C oxidase 6B [Perilla frutescens var. hirtella]KAH6816988.1 cytochrome C oxidase 6B [Perilla frutescens var. frutescens]